MSSSKSSHGGAEKLKDGARLVLLDVPPGTDFGIDYNSWTVGPNFRGVKNIPPGIHFVFYSAVNRDGQAAPRTGFFYNFQPREILVRKWDQQLEDVISPPTSEEDMQRLQSSLHEVDRYLGAYPYENYKKWVSLTSHVSPRIVGLLQPANGKISSVTEFVSERSTSQSRREAAVAAGGKADTDSDGLPNMQQCADSIINFSTIPQHRHPKGATPAEITQCGIDSSFALETLIAERYSVAQSNQQSSETAGSETSARGSNSSTKGDNPTTEDGGSSSMMDADSLTGEGVSSKGDGASVRGVNLPSEGHVSAKGDDSSKGENCDGVGFLGELQFAFVCFLLGQNYDSFEQWKKCLRLLCSSGESLRHRPQLFLKLVSILHFQVREVPADLFVDIVEGDNFLTQTLGEFFSRAEDDDIHPELRSRAVAFREHVTRKFGWDFAESDDCAPVVVDTGE